MQFLNNNDIMQWEKIYNLWQVIIIMTKIPQWSSKQYKSQAKAVAHIIHY